MLLTRSRLCPRPKPGSSLHLHVLSTPPAFVLSQDQTLRESLAWYQSPSPFAKQRASPLRRLTITGVPLSDLESCQVTVAGAYTAPTGLDGITAQPLAKPEVEPGRDRVSPITLCC